uniref:Uncharacterized protein n=1 Tax=Anguilla anguilla TaxID=7936 RepID=A0A0E9TLV3_ANGAN
MTGGTPVLGNILFISEQITKIYPESDCNIIINYS